MADTGNGATLTFSGFTAAIVSITPTAQTIGTNDKSTLATAGFTEKLAHDLADAGAFTVAYLFNSATAGDFPSLGGAAASATITWPLQSGTSAATLIGTAIKTSFTPPSQMNNELQTASLELTWDGVTGPAFTAEV